MRKQECHDLTVGIYAHNEEANISHVLEEITQRQSLSDVTEVIVVCSGCTDMTVPIVRRLASHDPRIELVIEPERRGVASAINEILTRCKTDLLVLVEADTRLYDGSVRRLASELEERGAGLVGAWPIIENENTGWIPRGLAFIRRVLLRSLLDLKSFADQTYSNSEFVCIRRSLVDQVPTDVVNIETYIDMTIHEAGYPVLPSRTVKVLIRLPENVSDYLAQRRRIYYGHMQIKNVLGQYASSMEGIALRRPGLVLRSTILELRVKPRLVFEIWPVLFLDLAAYVQACTDWARRANHLTWKMVSTTKWSPSPCRSSARTANLA